MVSTISWLDHSESQRRRMMEVVNLFHEKGTVDDLGFGSIRDGLSELLFPGTSVLHTRAAYLLFVPWIYRHLERQRVSAANVAKRARGAEIALIEAFLSGGETQGVIGREARSRLRQLPSAAYWSALGRYGIRWFPGTREQYHRSLDAHYRAGRQVTDDGEVLTGAMPNWDLELPDPEARGDLFAGQTFALSGPEAAYLQDRIRAAGPHTLLAFLLTEPARRAEVDMPWQHPALAEATARVQADVAHARRFSELAHGAQLHYNLLLAERVAVLRRRGQDGFAVGDDLVDHYRRELDEWRARLNEDWADYANWNLEDFWATVLRGNPALPRAARTFATWWVHRVLADPDDLDTDEVRQQLAAREHRLKGARARLSNDRALERWSGAAGADQLAFRWGSVRGIVNDVLDGLARR